MQLTATRQCQAGTLIDRWERERKNNCYIFLFCTLVHSGTKFFSLFSPSVLWWNLSSPKNLYPMRISLSHYEKINCGFKINLKMHSKLLSAIYSGCTFPVIFNSLVHLVKYVISLIASWHWHRAKSSFSLFFPFYKFQLGIFFLHFTVHWRLIVYFRSIETDDGRRMRKMMKKLKSCPDEYSMKIDTE